MTIETTNWNLDKFGASIESTKQYYRYRDDGKIDLLPIDGESVEGYTRRIANKLNDTCDISHTAHIYGGASGKSKMWYTHKMPRCWICDLETGIWLLYEQYHQICSILPQQGKLHVFRHLENGKIIIEDNSTKTKTKKP